MPNSAVCDTPSQRENVVASATKCSLGSHEDLKVNNLIFLLDHICRPEDLVFWSCSLQAPATFLNFQQSDTCSRCPHASLDTSLEWADINELPDLFTYSEPPVDMPDLQSSSEDSSRAGDLLQFPAFELPEFDIMHTEEAQQTDASSEDLPSRQSSSSDVSDQIIHEKDTSPLAGNNNNIYSVLATLCANFDIQTVHCRYKFSQEAGWLNKGPELSINTVIDICFDLSLSGPMLIKFLKSSSVPHTTVHVVTKLKAASVFSEMQQMYSSLQSHHQWPVCVAEAHSTLQE